ncbi:MAG: alpha/beta fold hydrolase [Thermoanaerobaculia bacterium]
MPRKSLLVLALLLAGCALRPVPVIVPTPQGQLHVFDSVKGTAIPIVFIHGNGANLTQWSGQIAHFVRNHRVIAIDLRGMGKSDVPADGVFTVPAMAEDIHVVVNALNVDRFVLVGHSFGGAVVAAYAAAHPERVAGVVYADSAGDIKATPEQSARYLDALRMDKTKVVRTAYEPILKTASAGVKAAVLDSVDRTSTEAYTESMESLLDFSVSKALAAYHGPVLAIASTDAPSSLHVQFPAIPVRRIDGVGHWLMMERPVEFNAILEEFLRGVGGR